MKPGSGKNGDATREQVQLLNHLASEDKDTHQNRQETVMNQMPKWDRLARVGSISASEADALAALHLKSLDEIEELILKNLSILIAMVKVLYVKGDAHPIQYVLTVLYELVRDNTGRYGFLCDAMNEMLVFAAFNQLLESSADTYSQDRAAFLLTGFMCRATSGKYSMEEVKSTAGSLINGRPHKKGGVSEAGKFDAIINLLKLAKYRHIVWETRGLIQLIKNNLRVNAPTNLQYRAAFCVWLLSFEDNYIPSMHRHGIDTAVCEVFKESRKEKVVRIILKAFKNLLKHDETVEALINANSYHILTILAYEKWRDAELYDEIREVTYQLDHKIKSFSNFDRYCAELERGQLRWSVLHSEAFWRNNVMSFEADEFLAVRKLFALLASEDSTTVSVACFDIGEFARFHPTGKKICSKYKAKEAVMMFINSSDRAVARESLMCLQKLMLNNWREISSSTSRA